MLEFVEFVARTSEQYDHFKLKHSMLVCQDKGTPGEFISVLLAFDKEVSLSPDPFIHNEQVPVVKIVQEDQVDGYVNQSEYFQFVVKIEFFYKEMQKYRIEVRKRQIEVRITDRKR